MNKWHLAYVFGLLLFCSQHSFADIHIENAWVRLLPPVARATAAYMDIVSTEDDRLLSASSSLAMMTELHESAMKGGVMTMDHVEHLSLPKGQTLSLTPGGYHLMLMNLHKPLEAGSTCKLTLKFEKAGTIELVIPVQ